MSKQTKRTINRELNLGRNSQSNAKKNVNKFAQPGNRQLDRWIDSHIKRLSYKENTSKT